MQALKKTHKQVLILTILVAGSFLGVSLFEALVPQFHSHSLSSFESYTELFDLLQSQSSKQRMYDINNGLIRTEESLDTLNPQSSSVGSDSIDYSETNVQVEGIDEPDIVKTDGTYLYILADATLSIVEAYPASSMKVESQIELNESYSYSSIFVSKDTLIIFGQSYPNYWLYDEPVIVSSAQNEQHEITEQKTNNDSKIDTIMPTPGDWTVTQTLIEIYDISEKSFPYKVQTIKIDGTFVNARMINDYVYLVVSESIYDIYREINDEDYFRIPQITVNETSENISSSSMYYVDEPEQATSFTHVMSINLNDYTYTEKSFLIGNTQEIYMSNQHLYLVYSSYGYIPRLFGSSSFNQNEQITKIHKIDFDKDKISYIGNGEVQGRLLNQFSMDEYNGYLRIATTTGYSWNDEYPSSNQVFILDDDLNIISSIRNIAPGEQIYSARFMGETAFLVTFKNTDPFFTLDLSNPENPLLLGELKLPGYSDYLHPYDENHIIGIGKDTVASNNPNFAWYQGVKLALFNVSDLTNPVLVDTKIIGDRGSSTPVLFDHHALLFDREKNLFVLPVSVYEIDDEQKTENRTDFDLGKYGYFTYQGAYVFTVTSNGFSLQNRITHINQTIIDGLQQHEWYLGNDNSFIQRSMFIENVLYTISNSKVQAHSLDSLTLLNEVSLSS